MVAVAFIPIVTNRKRMVFKYLRFVVSSSEGVLIRVIVIVKVSFEEDWVAVIAS